MFITLEVLQKYNACKSGIEWMKKHYPDGVDLIELSYNPEVTTDILHWGFENLPTTEEEKARYWKLFKVDCGDNSTIYKCERVKNSSFVTESHDVDNSHYVFKSGRVKNSKNVQSSNRVENSDRVYNSTFVYNSTKVWQGKNVNHSSNVLWGTYVVNSHSVLSADNVQDSFVVLGGYLGATKNIKDSAFIANCSNLKHCLFCADLNNEEYYIFNQKVDENIFKMVEQQLNDFIENFEPTLGDKWSEFTIPLEEPRVRFKFETRFAGLDNEFWDWVATLPGYDPKILFKITQDNRLIDKF